MAHHTKQSSRKRKRPSSMYVFKDSTNGRKKKEKLEAIRSCSCPSSPVLDSPFKINTNERKKKQRAKPAGFLDYCNGSSSGRKYSAHLYNQYYTLTSLFPDFPSNLLKTIFIREEGNIKSVSRILIDKGWIPTDKSKIAQLRDESIECLLSKSYWGVLQNDYLKILKLSPEGSYFYALSSSCEFVVCVHTVNRKILKIPTEYPIKGLEKEFFDVTLPLSRPKNIPLSNLLPISQKRLKNL